jgi:hypothetical protein
MSSQESIFDNSLLVNSRDYSSNSTSLSKSNSPITMTTTNDEDNEYLEKLDQYYSLKNEYESTYNNKKIAILKKDDLSISDKKDKIRKIQRNCISCKRPVKTIFKNEGPYLYALCGSTKNQCGLNIKINRGYFISLYELIDVYENGVEENKEKIIRSKLDYMFNLKTENEIVTIFNSVKNELNDDLESLLEYKTSFTNITENIDNKSLISSKTIIMNDNIKTIKENINQFNETGEIQFIKDVISMYIHMIYTNPDKPKLLPIISSLRDLKYKYFNMEDSILIRKKYTIGDLLVPFEKPKIDVFEIGTKINDSVIPDKAIDLSKLKSITPENTNDNITQSKGFYLKENKWFFNDNEIADKMDFQRNKELLKTLETLTPIQVNNMGYKFEMLYTSPNVPELFAINPENGKLFVVYFESNNHTSDKLNNIIIDDELEEGEIIPSPPIDININNKNDNEIEEGEVIPTPLIVKNDTDVEEGEIIPTPPLKIETVNQAINKDTVVNKKPFLKRKAPPIIPPVIPIQEETTNNVKPINNKTTNVKDLLSTYINY